MVETNFLKEYYSQNINELKDWIVESKEWMKVCARIRENYPKGPLIVELCREVIFDKAKEIRSYTNDIEKIRATIKKLG